MTGRPAPGSAPPGVEPSTWALLRAVAAHGLAGAPTIPTNPTIPTAPTTRTAATGGDEATSWRRIVRLAEQQRILGLLVAAVGDGALELGDAARHELAASHEAWCAHDLRLERLLVEADVALDEAGIAHLVTKGPALAHRIYADPGHRLFADLDLIVPSGQVRAATEALVTALGATVALGEVRPGFDERFGKETLLRTPPTRGAPAGLEIDLHRTPVAGALGLAIPLEELFDRPDDLVVAGRHLPTPGPAASLLLTAYQASVADIPPRLGARRDLVQMLVGPTGTGPPLDPSGAATVLAMADRWQASAVLALAVTEAWAVLDVDPPGTDRPGAARLVAWAHTRRPSMAERVLLDAHRRPGYVYWRQLAGVAVLPGVTDRAQYLRALVSPQSGYLAERSWSLGRHLRRAVRTVDAPVRNRLVAWGRRLGRRSGLRG